MNKSRILVLIFCLFLIFPASHAVLDVFVSDQTTRPLDLFFIQPNGPPTTLAQDAPLDQTWIIVTSAVSYSVGDYVSVFDPSANESGFYFGEVLAVSGTNISLDTPLDRNYSSGLNTLSFNRNLNVDGSSIEQIFEVQAGGPQSNVTIDITRLIVQITTDTAPDFGRFGDIAGGLTNGIVLRRVDGTTQNIWNVKTNQEFANLAYDYTDYDASNPGTGVFGLAVRYTFSGQDKHGVAVRLSPGDSLELLINDDLTDLLSFRIIAQGHVVDETDFSSVVTIPGEEQEAMMLSITFIIALIGLGFIFVYLSSQIKSNEVPKGRVPEKMIFYALSLGIIIAIAGFLLVLVNNNSSISYLSGPANSIFIVVLWCVFGVISFYLVYLYETVFKNKDKDLDEDDDD